MNTLVNILGISAAGLQSVTATPNSPSSGCSSLDLAVSSVGTAGGQATVWAGGSGPDGAVMSSTQDAGSGANNTTGRGVLRYRRLLSTRVNPSSSTTLQQVHSATALSNANANSNQENSYFIFIFLFSSVLMRVSDPRPTFLTGPQLLLLLGYKASKPAVRSTYKLGNLKDAFILIQPEHAIRYFIRQLLGSGKFSCHLIK